MGTTPTKSVQKQLKKNIKSAIALSGEPIELVGIYDLRFDKKYPKSLIPEVPNDFFEENEDGINLLAVIKANSERWVALYYTNTGVFYVVDAIESIPEIERFLRFLPEPLARE